MNLLYIIALQAIKNPATDICAGFARGLFIGLRRRNCGNGKNKRPHGPLISFSA